MGVRRAGQPFALTVAPGYGSGAMGVLDFDGVETIEGMAPVDAGGGEFYYVLTKELHATDLILREGIWLIVASCRLFWTRTLYLAGRVFATGNSAAADVAGTAHGINGPLGGNYAGGNGGQGNGNAANAGTASAFAPYGFTAGSNAGGASGLPGAGTGVGRGGGGGGGVGAAGATGGAVTVSTQLIPQSFDDDGARTGRSLANVAMGGGSGGGGGMGAGAALTAKGGGGGAGGGIIVAAGRRISYQGGTFDARGGDGAAGNPNAGTGTGAGGGGGGGGGVISLTFELGNVPTAAYLYTGGAGGAAFGAGGAGGAGGDGLLRLHGAGPPR